MAIAEEELLPILDAYQRATSANRESPGRQGNVIELTAELADDVLITGDLHGHHANYESIVRVADLDSHPRRHLVLQEVCHGGPVYESTGGCMSHLLLEAVAHLKAKYPHRVHFLLGNHELAEMVDYPIQKRRRLLNLAFRVGLQTKYGPALDRIRDAYQEFLRSCPLAVRLPHGIFVSHSAPEHVDLRQFDASIFARPLEPADYREHSPVFELVWGRDYRPANARAFADLVGARVLIHGHDPCPEGFAAPNDVQVIVDCCGQPACYLLLSTDRPWTHNEMCQQIRRLG